MLHVDLVVVVFCHNSLMVVLWVIPINGNLYNGNLYAGCASSKKVPS